MKLHDLLKPELVNINCRATATEELLLEITRDLKMKQFVSDEFLIRDKLMEREKLGTTSIGNHSAVPHTKLKELKEPVIYIGISKNGIRYHPDDKQLVHLIILILSPNHPPITHLQILAAAASLIKNSDRLIKEILAINSPEQLIKLITRYETSND